jgi:hypothetical protein
VLEFHGWTEIGEKLPALAARGLWSEMPDLVSDEILAEFCTEAESPSALAAVLKERYNGIADRLMLYIPFAPGEKDAWWAELVEVFK